MNEDQLMKVAKSLKIVRRKFDDLMKRYGYKRPTNYSKLRSFTDELIEIVDSETRAAGFLPPKIPYLKKPVKVPDLEEHSPEVEEKGNVIVRETVTKKSKGKKSDNSDEEAQKDSIEEVA